MARPRQHALVDRTCKRCGADYQAPPYKLKVYCSPACHAAPLQHRLCERCGVYFTREAFRPVRRFCSQRCHLAFQMRAHWDRVGRKEVEHKKRYGLSECRVEGCTNPPHKILHKSNGSYYGTLCLDHRKRHRFDMSDRYVSERRYGPEFAEMHQANKAIKRMLKSQGVAIPRGKRS